VGRNQVTYRIKVENKMKKMLKIAIGLVFGFIVLSVSAFFMFGKADSDEAKKLGFASVSEMKDIHAKGWHTMQRYDEDRAKAGGYASVAEMKEAEEAIIKQEEAKALALKEAEDAKQKEIKEAEKAEKALALKDEKDAKRREIEDAKKNQTSKKSLLSDLFDNKWSIGGLFVVSCGI